VDWSRVEFFWGDERACPPDDPDSNFGLARALLLDRVKGIRPQAVHRMPADANDRDRAASRYQAEIARAFKVPADASRPPALDLIWLGMGRDGHTASLFPGASALAERRRWVVATQAPPPSGGRISFTLPLINAARAVMFVAVGADKSAALRSVRSGSSDVPAAHVRAQSTLWLVDAAAAGTPGGS
jgi:6-phosphogluconolactonase